MTDVKRVDKRYTTRFDAITTTAQQKFIENVSDVTVMVEVQKEHADEFELKLKEWGLNVV